MADPSVLIDDENYNSASDDEFNPDTVVAEEDSSSSSSDDESNNRASNRKTTKNKRKRDTPDDEALDSGDEVTINKARKKRRGGRKDGSDDEDVLLSDAEGGEGGLVKTRAQRRTEQKERRPLAGIEGATANIDEIWSQLASAPVARHPEPSTPTIPTNGDAQKPSATPAATAPEDEETITIKRTYDFAGDRITEERQVPKNSAEAKLYLSQQEAQKQQEQKNSKTDAPSRSASATPPPDGAPAAPSEDAKSTVRRPLRRPSRFDPNPTGEVKGLPADKQLTWANRRRLLDPTLAAASPIPLGLADKGGSMTPAEGAAAVGAQRLEKAQKLNTVDKSRLDWAGYVDREGIADELDEYGRAKEGYLGRMDFLSRVDERREAERREAKMKGVGA
ncbi:bucentaur or craniofacial development-domain-containing protein [Phyllosticta capitalensis]|uniref:SWR1-complex protein 5 n=1 Tax=Phyllosticta capitalensis TaxID=121624 RepID=A0ABR1YNA2_9PEZI